MLKISGFAKEGQSCFVTESKKDVVIVKFMDGSFTGCISWEELLKVMRRKAAAENEKPEREAKQANFATTVKPEN